MIDEELATKRRQCLFLIACCHQILGFLRITLQASPRVGGGVLRTVFWLLLGLGSEREFEGLLSLPFCSSRLSRPSRAAGAALRAASGSEYSSEEETP